MEATYFQLRTIVLVIILGYTPGHGELLHQHQVLFSREGQMYHTKAFIHLRTTLDLDPTLKECEMLKQSASRLRQILAKDLHKVTMFHLDIHRVRQSEDELLHACTNVETLAQLYHPMTKSKRSIWTKILGTLFGFLGLNTLLGLGQDQPAKFNVQHLEHDLRLENEKINQIQSLLSKVIKDQAAHQDEMYLNVLISSFQTMVQALKEKSYRIQIALQDLQHQKLAPFVFEPQTLIKIWPELQQIALRLGGLLPVNVPEQIAQFPVSTLVHEKTMTILVHIPVIQNGRIWELFRLSTSPLLLPPTSNGTLAMEVVLRPAKPVLASDGSGRHLTLGDSDLSACLQIRQAYFCPTFLIRKTSEDCLSRLFLNQIQNISTICPTYLRLVDQSFVKTEKHWLGYSKNLTIMEVSCSNGTRKNLNLQGIFTLPYLPSCNYENDNFLLSGYPQPAEELLEARINLSPALPHLLGLKVEEEEVQQVIHQTHQQEINLADILRHRSLLLSDAQDSRLHHYHFGVHGLILLVLVILISTLIGCTYLNHRHGAK